MADLRIVSDGHTTKVLTKDGDQIDGITEIAFVHRTGEPPQAQITIAGVELTVGFDDDPWQ